MTRLKDKVAFVTGGAAGIGRAQAIRFAQEGASVLIADRDFQGAVRLANEIKGRGGYAEPVEIDVTDDKSIQSAVAKALDTYGRIDILSNTAGAFDGFTQTLDTSRELWDRVIAVNLTSIYLVTNAVISHMIHADGGVVLNVTSAAGLRGGGGGASYTSSKHAVVGYTRQLAAAYGRLGIRANAIAPGLIDTAMVADFSSSPETKAMYEAKPAGRLGTADDIANAALFLVSDEASFIHGVTLEVDGGMTNVF
jgi:3-oxoacyl-[acyl-carrier protein] reductase